MQGDWDLKLETVQAFSDKTRGAPNRVCACIEEAKAIERLCIKVLALLEGVAQVRVCQKEAQHIWSIPCPSWTFGLRTRT